MQLPIPIPDNPNRWDGWRLYNSDNPYERLCLSFEANPSNEQIEENCRQLLMWWQRKLPLKNQPSNPITQLLRNGIDDAPQFLAEARTKLLDPESRRAIDQQLRQSIKSSALAEFTKFLSFATAGGTLSDEDESNLMQVAHSAGLSDEDVLPVIEEEIARRGIRRINREEIAREAAAAATAAPPSHPSNPSDEFRRLLRLSGLSDEDMTDDQRDALCNMGENLGLTGGQAEDLIDEYLEEVSGVPLSPTPPPARKPVAAKPAPQQPAPAIIRTPAPAAEPLPVFSPLTQAKEREAYPAFRNSIGMDMLLVTSGVFTMGSTARDAAPNEQPASRVVVPRFFMSRFPVTNEQFELFDPAHKTKRPSWADGRHPVVYVSSEDAINFCKWLSNRERRKYRLPTEAEWEYAARGLDGRVFPWGDRLGRGDLANFADAQTTFAWRDPSIDDGAAQSSRVGAYPRGASPFGMEDMAGNVWEWCADFYAPYTGKDRPGPQGPSHGSQRVYRGGSWKSRAASLRTSARAFNLPLYSANDVGFRVACDVD